jgi:pimeloyl-ACP methyl ester carboxylesterase
MLAALGLDRVHAIGPDVGTCALLFAANAHSDLFESLVVGSGATDAALTAGALKDIINAPSTASFEGSSGEMFATGAIDLMMKTKPDSQALKDYQASSAGRRFIEAMAYVRAYPIDLPSYADDRMSPKEIPCVKTSNSRPRTPHSCAAGITCGTNATSVSRCHESSMNGPDRVACEVPGYPVSTYALAARNAPEPPHS